MSLYSNTLQVLRHYLSSAVGDLVSGICGTTGATTTKIYAPFLWQASDYYNNHNYEVYVYAGTNIGVTKRVTDWDLASFLLTVHSAYVAACDATSYIELHHIFSEDKYRKAINLAIESLSTKYLVDKIDATITLVEDVYEYTLPMGINFIHKITTEDEEDGGEFFNSGIIDPRTWSLISPRKLKLDNRYYSITAGKDLRIEGQGRQSTLTSDSSICYLPPDWLIKKAITLLPGNKIESNSLSGTFNRAMDFVKNEPKNLPYPQSRTVLE